MHYYMSLITYEVFQNILVLCSVRKVSRLTLQTYFFKSWVIFVNYPACIISALDILMLSIHCCG